MSRLGPGLAVILLLLLAGCSRNPHYYFDKANKLAADGKPDEALLMYRKAIQRDDNFGEAYYRMGSLLWRVHRGQEAYAVLLRAVELLPDRADVKAKLGDLELASWLAEDHRSLKLHDKIRDLSDQLLAANPESYDGLRLKAHLAAADRNYDDAARLYSRANQVRPLQTELVLGWTEVLLEDGRPEEAEREGLQLIGRASCRERVYACV